MARNHFLQLTSRAKETLESLGIPVYEQHSDIYDSVLKHQSLRAVDVELDGSEHRFKLSPEIYYYLIREVVFKSTNEILDIVDDPVESSGWREKLLGQPADWQKRRDNPFTLI